MSTLPFENRTEKTPFCPDRETLRIRLKADLQVYLDAVTELQRNIENEKAHKLLDRARIAYDAARNRLTEHTASHGCG